MIHAALGQMDLAFQSLERAYNEHSDWVGYACVDPRFDLMRSDVRFAEFRKKLGFDAQIRAVSGTPAALLVP